LPTLEGSGTSRGRSITPTAPGSTSPTRRRKKVDLKASYEGKGGAKVEWKEFADFQLGKLVDLQKLFPKVRTSAVVYLYHQFESPKAFKWPLSFGSDDTAQRVHQRQARPPRGARSRSRAGPGPASRST